MPMYEGICEDCGVVEELFRSPLGSEIKEFSCPDCGGTARRIMSESNIIGVTHSKPFVAGTAGETFETNTQMRNYFKENPSARVREWDSAWGRNYKEKYQHKADLKAQKMGFKNARERMADAKKQQQDAASRPKPPPAPKPPAPTVNK